MYTERVFPTEMTFHSDNKSTIQAKVNSLKEDIYAVLRRSLMMSLFCKEAMLSFDSKYASNIYLQPIIFELYNHYVISCGKTI